MSRILCDSLLRKVEEQVERTAHLAALLPDGAVKRALDSPDGWTAGDLLGHLLDCLAGFCAVLYAAEPGALAHFQHLREQAVNIPLDEPEFRMRLENYRTHIAEGFAFLDDAGLTRNIPTVFVPPGETLMTLLLGNLEHLINHKRQLFEFLKREHVNVGTADLYAFRLPHRE